MSKYKLDVRKEYNEFFNERKKRWTSKQEMLFCMICVRNFHIIMIQM